MLMLITVNDERGSMAYGINKLWFIIEMAADNSQSSLSYRVTSGYQFIYCSDQVLIMATAGL